MSPQAPPTYLRTRMTKMSFPSPNRVLSCCLAALLAVGTASAVHAQVTVDGAWARATVPNQSATGAFMRLTAQKDVVLTRASSPVADIRRSTRDVDGQGHHADASRRSRSLEGRPDDRAEIWRPARHDDGPKKRQIKAGERVPLTLSFTAADSSVSTVEVNATAAFAPPTR